MEFTDSLIGHYKKMLAYDQWAIGLLLGDMEKLPAPDPAALVKVSHVLCSQEVWVIRLLGGDSSGFTSIWPVYSLAQCKEKLAELGKNWARILEGLKPEDIGKIISYKNTKGEPCQLAVGGILAQTFDHSTYHRGQIATAIKKAGGEPHSTGFFGYLMQVRG